MKPNLIDDIRDIALKMERYDLKASYILMKHAYEMRPNEFIKKKYLEYKNLIENSLLMNQYTLQDLVKSGDLVIIPIGFKCETKSIISRVLDINQPSLPFDAGFFSPSSVTSILKNPKIYMDFNNKSSYKICKKAIRHKHPKYGEGIKFAISSKEEIDLKVSQRNQKNVNRFLDDTLGYYTLDTQHNYVLAHYNWSELTPIDKSKGCTDMQLNLKNTSSMLNRRIKRMMDMCHSAKNILFFYHNADLWKFMLAGKKMMLLDDFSELKKTANDIFKSNIHVLDSKELNLSKLLKIINNTQKNNFLNKIIPSK